MNVTFGSIWPIYHPPSLVMLLLRLDCYDPGVWRFTQPLLVLPAVVSFDSHVVDIRKIQTPCCWCGKKTNDMLLMSKQNKSLVEFCQNNYLGFSKLFDRFLKIALWISLDVTWICQCCYMDLLKLLRDFVEVVLNGKSPKIFLKKIR